MENSNIRKGDICTWNKLKKKNKQWKPFSDFRDNDEEEYMQQ